MNGSNRLYPHWTSSRYCVLTKLRKTIQEFISLYVISSRTVSHNGLAIDLGCGSMPYRRLFEPYFSQYMGVDLSENKNADLHFDPQTSKVPLPENAAKLIVSTQVLEHTRNPGTYLLEAKRLLEWDGIMILSTHGYWREHPDPHDYWRWTSEGLLTLLDDNGWEVIGFSGVLGLAPAALQLFQDAVLPKVPSVLRRLFVIFMQSSICVLDRLYSPEDRVQDPGVFVLAARPKRE